VQAMPKYLFPSLNLKTQSCEDQMSCT
jgi:hypothetical protein